VARSLRNFWRTFFLEGSSFSFCLEEKSRGCPEFEKFGDLTEQKPPLDKLESYHQIQMHFCINSCISVKVCYHQHKEASYQKEQSFYRTNSREHEKIWLQIRKDFFLFIFFAFLEVFQEEWFVFERSASSTLWLDFLKNNSSATR